jgi:hypothetical protein
VSAEKFNPLDRLNEKYRGGETFWNIDRKAVSST